MRRTLALSSTHRLPSLLSSLFDLVERNGARSLDRVLAALEIALGAKEAQHPDPLFAPKTIYVPGLEARRWHDVTREPLCDVAAMLERAHPAIRMEAEALMGGGDCFVPYMSYDSSRAHAFEGLREDRWQVCFLKGGSSTQFRDRQNLCPATCGVVNELSRYSGPHFEAFFAIMQPGAELRPHFGDANIQLSAHLPVIVPAGCGMDVAGETRSPEEGKCFVFDDSFLHSAWNRGDRPRVHLIVSIWHPGLNEVERQACTLIADHFRSDHATSMEDRVARVLIEERSGQLGTNGASHADISHEAVCGGLKKVEDAARQLLANPIHARRKILETLRGSGLYPLLDWTPATPPADPVASSQWLKSRDPATFVILSDVNAEGQVETYIECAGVELTIEEEWRPFFEKALSGGPFQVAAMLQAAPQSSEPELAGEYLTALRDEGLLEAVTPTF